MLPMYLRHFCLGYGWDEWERHAPPTTKSHRRSLPPACLRSWTQVNFRGIPGVKTGMTNVAGDFCSYMGTVFQAVPAAMTQKCIEGIWEPGTQSPSLGILESKLQRCSTYNVRKLTNIISPFILAAHCYYRLSNSVDVAHFHSHCSYFF